MFYAVKTARVIFTAKTSLDVFSLRREHVWTFSVLCDQIYKMRCPFVAEFHVDGWKTLLRCCIVCTYLMVFTVSTQFLSGELINADPFFFYIFKIFLFSPVFSTSF